MTLFLSLIHENKIRMHCQAGYPDEVCGFLIGRDSEAGIDRTVSEIRPAPNTFEGNKRTRFVIHPKELMQLEDSLEGSGTKILGFYHSHPDHPAEPSQFDREHAWPWYSYVVLSVRGGRATKMTAWRLRDDRTRFDPDPLGRPRGG